MSCSTLPLFAHTDSDEAYKTFLQTFDDLPDHNTCEQAWVENTLTSPSNSTFTLFKILYKATHLSTSAKNRENNKNISPNQAFKKLIAFSHFLSKGGFNIPSIPDLFEQTRDTLLLEHPEIDRELVIQSSEDLYNAAISNSSEIDSKIPTQVLLGFIKLCIGNLMRLIPLESVQELGSELIREALINITEGLREFQQTHTSN
ncbi:hypothetical protein COB21_01585 [Candidatus Aerophobetes bacterium]|uniref:Uncharacterized protein n=1 Tax=Aerophobetes bacterium TaxID=2030807 RepID=A0A2A4X6Q3_UNCAE|nr:MAG: hypothetical protein COB21_01585 [Candidatus Aerophobetes bacterium]